MVLCHMVHRSVRIGCDPLDRRRRYSHDGYGNSNRSTIMWILIAWFLTGHVRYYGPFKNKQSAAKFDREYVQKLPGLSGDTSIQPLINPGIAKQ